MFDAEGDRAAALRAVRRRDFGYGGLEYLSTALREEGRLAELIGDRAAAAKAYQHYLRLRSKPEPGIAAKDAEVRNALAALVSEP